MFKSQTLLCIVCSALALSSAQQFNLESSRQAAKEDVHQRSYVNLPITSELALQRYVVNFTVGTPPQSFSLTIDTGSSNLWLPLANSSGCAPNCPPGAFNAATSSTFKQIPGIKFVAVYGTSPNNPNTTVTGPYFKDIIRLGNATLDNVTALADSRPVLALGNVPPLLYVQGTYGIFSLGPPTGQASLTEPPAGNSPVIFPTVYDGLLSQGYISHRAASLYLNQLDASTGSLIFGGIDTSKFHGGLVSLPVQLQDSHFDSWTIALTSVTRLHGQNRTALTAANYSIGAVLDTGPPSMYLPVDLATAIQANLGATVVQGTPYVPCAVNASQEVLEFGLGGPGGPKIDVPYASLVNPFGTPANRGDVVINGTEYCYFGVIGIPGSIFLLGETFQRAAYLVYDVDNERVAIAQARYDNDDEEHIVEIPAGTHLPCVTSTNTYLLPTPTAI